MNYDKKRTFEALARRFVNYQELFKIPIQECKQCMKSVEDYSLGIDFSYSKLAPSNGDKLILRKGVCERLLNAQNVLDSLLPGSRLTLVYAYRSLEIQIASFIKMRKELKLGDRTDPEAMELIHHFIAVPEVSGHPTGGAIDLLIKDKNNKPLDFGTEMHALEQNSYVFSPFITNEATINRKLLRFAMTQSGFAPYDGEWWHFSYGDREWAAYYNEPCAFYGQLSETEISF